MPPRKHPIDQSKHVWLSAKKYFQNGWILATHAEAVKIKSKIGPQTKDEAKQWIAQSSPWQGTRGFNGTSHAFTVEKMDQEEGTASLLFGVKYEDGDREDLYWCGVGGLYDCLTAATKKRVDDMLGNVQFV